MTLHIDCETKSECDLTSYGSYNYAIHPTTDILCLSYQINSNEIQTWLPEQLIPQDLLEALKIYPAWAWNSVFESQIYNHILIPKYGFPKFDNWKCSMALAASFAIPQNLKAAGKFLELPIEKQKLNSGTRLINKLCVPRKETKTNKIKWWTPETAPLDFEELYKYCEFDVIAEQTIFSVLPKQELFDCDKKVWALTNKINSYGILVDIYNAKIIKNKLKEYNILKNKRIAEITNNEVTSILQRDKTINWIKSKDIFISDLTVDTVEEFLEKDLPKEVLELLQIRRALSQSSVKKCDQMVNLAGPDNRIRNSLRFYGASTGRFSSNGLQLQNFPRDSFENDEEAEMVLQNIADLSFQELESKYKISLPSLSKKLLRHLIIAPKGKDLLGADLSSIENRISSFVANDNKTLELFKNNFDQYIDFASVIFKLPKPEISKEQRTIAKVCVLAAMYGQGAIGLQRTLKNWGIEINENQAKIYIQNYRTQYSLIVNSWYELERKCQISVQTGKIEMFNNIIIKKQGDFLFLKLPIGRVLSYYKPEIQDSNTPWGDVRKVINFKTTFGIKPLRGALIFQNLVQAISRDVLCEILLELDKNNFSILTSIHDEVLVESNKERFNEFMKIMTIPPKWGETIPLEATGFYAKRYRK